MSTDSFVSFSPLISVTRTSKTVYSKSGEHGHACFVPDLRGFAVDYDVAC